LSHRRLEQTNDLLRHQLEARFNIVGESIPIKALRKQIAIVAPTNSRVLIYGESGTGKELVSRNIHSMSNRANAPFVEVNCAAIPEELIESELFGHTKGAFTGASEAKKGKFELADGGTLFLDEIGDMSLKTQAKVLRSLEEQCFQPIGAPAGIRVDVRVISATNKNLQNEIAGGRFREDLFYRLNVIPFFVPPLRERREDIPILVRYFVDKFARRMDRRIETIPAEVMRALTRWDWRGNIRELENFIERAVLLSKGPALRAPLAELELAEEPSPESDSTLETSEREHILRVLREAKGVIAGPNGAAARLGLKRTTLNSKLKKLGIERGDFM
jgi:formate hydrogenlyase transcriptional activator